MGNKKEPSNITKSIGLRLKKERNKKFRKAVDFAKILGITSSQLSDWEAGRTTFSAEQIEEVATHLGISAGWLLTGEKTSGTQKKSPSTEDDGGKEMDKKLIDAVFEMEIALMSFAHLLVTRGSVDDAAIDTLLMSLEKLQERLGKRQPIRKNRVQTA